MNPADPYHCQQADSWRLGPRGRPGPFLLRRSSNSSTDAPQQQQWPHDEVDSNRNLPIHVFRVMRRCIYMSKRSRKMTSIRTLLFVLVGLAVLSTSSAAADTRIRDEDGIPPKKPNILFISVDDLNVSLLFYYLCVALICPCAALLMIHSIYLSTLSNYFCRFGWGT